MKTTEVLESVSYGNLNEDQVEIQAAGTQDGTNIQLSKLFFYFYF